MADGNFQKVVRRTLVSLTMRCTRHSSSAGGRNVTGGQAVASMATMKVTKTNGPVVLFGYDGEHVEPKCVP
jgi:hypothetical protein